MLDEMISLAAKHVRQNYTKVLHSPEPRSLLFNTLTLCAWWPFVGGCPLHGRAFGSALALPLAPIVGTCPIAVKGGGGGGVHPWLCNTSFTAQTCLHFFLKDSESMRAVTFNVALEQKLYLLWYFTNKETLHVMLQGSKVKRVEGITVAVNLTFLKHDLMVLHRKSPGFSCFSPTVDSLISPRSPLVAR